MAFLQLMVFAIVVSHTLALSEKTIELTKELSKFSANLYHECAESSEENIIVSPYSVATAVAFLSQGANGKTFDEVVTALHLPSNKTIIADLFSELTTYFEDKENHYWDSPQLSVANRIYLQRDYNVSDAFNVVATTKFQTAAEVVDFSKRNDTANKINRWVENKTRNKIKDLVNPEILTEDTRLILINAIYFKGSWEHEFDRFMTKRGKFYINDNDTVNVEFMYTREGFDYAVLDDLDAIALKMLYSASDVYFLIILPNKRDGLSELENKLKGYDMTKIAERMEEELVKLFLPKFKIDFEINLNDVLKKMGIIEMFSGTADFSDLLDPNAPLKVSDVIHKAFIEVNEEGTEAAAATSIGMETRMGKFYDKEYTLKVDHPFLLSVNKDNTAIFTGRVNRIEN